MHGSMRETFSQGLHMKRPSMAEDLVDDDDEVIVRNQNEVEGEEVEGTEKFNESGDVIEPFNLRDERDLGYFDQNHNFIWKKEEGEQDAWLAELSEAQMEQAIGEAAKAQRALLSKQSAEPEPASIDPIVLKRELRSLLFEGETVTDGLRRLGQATKQSKTKREPQRTAADSTTAEEKERAKAMFNRLTEVADLLLSAGEFDVYQLTLEELGEEADLTPAVKRPRDTNTSTDIHTHQYTQPHTHTHPNETAPKGFEWEYRGNDGQVHGPFSTQQILAWKQQGFFSGDSVVSMKLVSWPASYKVSGEREAKRARVDTSTDADTLLADLDDEDDEEAAATHTDTHTPIRTVDDKYLGWQGSDVIPFEMFS